MDLVTWAVILIEVICAFGIAVGGFLAGASVLGFRRCRTCHLYGQVTGDDLTQCGECWRRQAQFFTALDTFLTEGPLGDPKG
jgi:hypothetical protein